MKLSKLIRYCLQFLEQNSDINVLDENVTIKELTEDDTFKEYMYNIENSIYMGLVRYATSKVLPIQQAKFEDGSSRLELTKALQRGESIIYKRMFHSIKEVYAIDKNGNIISPIKYRMIGNTVFLTELNPNLEYYVIYYPTINELSCYDGYEDYEIELDNMSINGEVVASIPDEMAINIKYLVYSDMKLEENPSVANINKNYFENYLSAMQTDQVDNNPTEARGIDFTENVREDIYANDPLNRGEDYDY